MRVKALPKEERVRRYKEWKARRDADTETRKKFLLDSSAYTLKRRYGLTEHNIVELATTQGGVCAICGDPPDPSRKRGGLHVDHDHSTGEIRGLLCESCNIGLGFFKDSAKSLLSAIDYLKAPPAFRVILTEAEPKPSLAGGVPNPEKQALLKLHCKQCGKIIYRKAKTEYACRSKGKEGPFCSRACSGAWGQSQQQVVGLVHGTTSGYTYYRCRCPQCKGAHAQAERARSQRKTEP